MRHANVEHRAEAILYKTTSARVLLYGGAQPRPRRLVRRARRQRLDLMSLPYVAHVDEYAEPGFLRFDQTEAPTPFARRT
jgi:hypothetical protein